MLSEFGSRNVLCVLEARVAPVGRDVAPTQGYGSRSTSPIGRPGFGFRVSGLRIRGILGVLEARVAPVGRDVVRLLDFDALLRRHRDLRGTPTLQGYRGYSK